MINYHVLMNSIVLNYDGKTLTINQGDARYSKVLSAIKEDRLKEIPEIVDIEASLEKDGFKLVDGKVQIDGKDLPKALSQRIVEFKNQGLPLAPLLNLWDNLKANPSFNSREMLYRFLEHNGHPITEDGCFIAYRGVTSDFKDLRTKTFDNSVGSICEMPRADVDDNPDNTCSNGLHVACFNYADGFGPELIEVKVNPLDVVCIPRDYSGTKMRVCKFEVVNVCKNINNEPLYGHESVDERSFFFDDESDDIELDGWDIEHYEW